MAKIKKAQGGSYITTKSGRVGRTNGEMSPYESIDTTGYTKGKKEFNLDSSLSGGTKSSSKIKREDVPAKIKEFKKGATRKVKLKNGGSLSGLKASNKRVGPVDPKGAFTKVQKKTLAGAKGKASLTKDKQLGATKMAKCGAKMSKK
jgi:hypothetical protein